MKRVQTQLKALQATESQLRTDYQVLEEKSQAKNEKSSKQITALEAKIEKLEAQIAELVNSNSSYLQDNAKLSKLQTQYESLVAMHLQLETTQAQESADFEALLVEKENEIETIKAAQARQESKIVRLETELRESTEKIISYENSMRSIFSSLDLNEAQMNTLQAFMNDQGATRASGTRRPAYKMYAKQRQIIDLLNQVIKIVESAHPVPTPSRRPSGRRSNAARGKSRLTGRGNAARVSGRTKSRRRSYRGPQKRRPSVAK